uniref:Uncharacterized protein n=1 Tax=Timema tahoe TaxID=61484 RepID=A0A7R9IL39_9NEOP|nr:unnamed protein product [Timema tahoe]
MTIGVYELYEGPSGPAGHFAHSEIREVLVFGHRGVVDFHVHPIPAENELLQEYASNARFTILVEVIFHAGVEEICAMDVIDHAPYVDTCNGISSQKYLVLEKTGLADEPKAVSNPRVNPPMERIISGVYWWKS